MARTPVRRLIGLDRSGPPPPETAAGAPLRPWTIPNAVSFARLALIPVFLVLALAGGEGVSALAIVIFAICGWGDYADGLLAREATILVLARVGLGRGVDVRVNWPGRLSIPPLLGGIFFAMAGLQTLGEVLFLAGLALSLTAMGLYIRTGIALRAKLSSSA